MAVGLSKTKWFGILNVKVPSVCKGITLSYEGKKSREQILSQPYSKSMFVKQAKDSDEINTLFFANNKDVLLELLNDDNIKGKVKLIYIDPPFATNSIFQSAEQKDAYTDLLQGSEFIEFMRERLIMLYELLADDGSIYVHLDKNMAFEIKIIMDEIFCKSNFRNWITRKKCSTKNTTKKQYGNISDYILFYTKSAEYIWNRPSDPWTEERIKKQYPFIDEKTGRRYKRVPIHAPGTRKGATGQQWRGMFPPKGKHWQFVPSKLDEMDKKGEIYWSSNNNPRRKVFFNPNENAGVPRQDIWLDNRDSANQNVKTTGYPTEKNFEMMDMIIKTSSNDGDLVLDCFCGSGTTLEAAKKNNRKWIGVDNSFEAISSSLFRLNNGAKRKGDYVNPTVLIEDYKKLFDEIQLKNITFNFKTTQEFIKDISEITTKESS